MREAGNERPGEGTPLDHQSFRLNSESPPPRVSVRSLFEKGLGQSESGFEGFEARTTPEEFEARVGNSLDRNRELYLSRLRSCLPEEGALTDQQLGAILDRTWSISQEINALYDHSAEGVFGRTSAERLLEASDRVGSELAESILSTDRYVDTPELLRQKATYLEQRQLLAHAVREQLASEGRVPLSLMNKLLRATLRVAAATIIGSVTGGFIFEGAFIETLVDGALVGASTGSAMEAHRLVDSLGDKEPEIGRSTPIHELERERRGKAGHKFEMKRKTK